LTTAPQARAGPELLAPAGTLRNLHYALAYGADAVYAGIPRYSLRVRNNDFDRDNLAAGIAAAHAAGRRFYLAANLMPHGAKLATFLDDLAPLVALGPDALIMADPGLILLVRERWPDLPIHLSVQANTTNAAAVRFWQRQGLTRVILSRELSLEGRTKSHYYTARTTGVYRRAIDDASAGRPFDPQLLEALDGLANRDYTEGFYRRHAPADLQNYDDGSSRHQRRQLVGDVLSRDPGTGLAEIAVRNRFAVGDRLELLTPAASQTFRLQAMVSAEDGRALAAAPGDGWRVRLQLPPAETDYGLLLRILN